MNPPSSTRSLGAGIRWWLIFNDEPRYSKSDRFRDRPIRRDDDPQYLRSTSRRLSMRLLIGLPAVDRTEASRHVLPGVAGRHRTRTRLNRLRLLQLLPHSDDVVRFIKRALKTDFARHRLNAPDTGNTGRISCALHNIHHDLVLRCEAEPISVAAIISAGGYGG